jgi:hypothetical protein
LFSRKIDFAVPQPANKAVGINKTSIMFGSYRTKITRAATIAA